MSPAGAATAAARPSTNNVLSNIERTITLPTWGFLYGGSSSANDDGRPLRMVFDNIFDTNKVMNTPKRITPVNISVDRIDLNGTIRLAAKNIVIIDIMVGNAPPSKWQTRQK